MNQEVERLILLQDLDLISELNDPHLPAHVEEQTGEDQERDKNTEKTVTSASAKYKRTDVTCPGCHTYLNSKFKISNYK